MSALLFWILYFAPTLIASYRARNGKPVAGPVLNLFLFNLFLGWTVVGWLLPMANAFGKNPVPGIAKRLANVLPGGQTANPNQGTTNSPAASSCSQCQGSGTLPCSTCSARGSWYDSPQGEHGSAQLRSCPACMSSGRLRCTYCGGSGRTVP